jgi:hypothetical protein
MTAKGAVAIKETHFRTHCSFIRRGQGEGWNRISKDWFPPVWADCKYVGGNESSLRVLFLGLPRCQQPESKARFAPPSGVPDLLVGGDDSEPDKITFRFSDAPSGAVRMNEDCGLVNGLC